MPEAQIINSCVTGIILLDAQAKVEFINESAMKLTNLDEKAINSEHVSGLSQLLEAIKSGAIKSELAEAKYKKYIREEISINGHYLSVHISLFSENKYLLELSRIVQKDIGHTTHELKRPIQNIKTSIETLLMGAKDDKQHADKFLNNINHEVDRLGVLVNDILRLTQIKTGAIELRRQDLNFKELLDKVLKSYEADIKNKAITLSLDLEEGLILNADKELLSHLLENIISNAIKYNKEDGAINIKAEKNSFSISDTGIGMPKEAIDKLGEEFYRVENARHIQGSGLGMSIVKSIIDLHDWSLNIDSAENKGTCFKVICA